MNIIFYLAHPAHYHLFRNILKKLESKNHKIFITIKKKDVIELLLTENNVLYFNIQPNGRKSTELGIIKGLAERSLKHFKFIKQQRIDTILSSSAELGPIAKLFNIPFINVLEDDLTLFPTYSKVLGPFINSLVVPISCKTGKWEYKTIKYNGFRQYQNRNRSNVSRIYIPFSGCIIPV